MARHPVVFASYDSAGARRLRESDCYDRVVRSTHLVSALAPALLLGAFLGCGGSEPRATADLEPPPDAGTARQLTGMYSYMADAANFVDCESGKRYPVSMEADNLALERAYLSVRSEPAEQILVTLQGRFELRPPMEGDQEVEKLIPVQFGQFWPGEECP